jgi:ankyrin repeat protein
VALESAPDLVPVLRKLGAPLDAVSAAFLDDVETLTRHLDDGAPLSDRATGTDLLSWAAYGGAPATARLLLERGARADGGALYAAAERGHTELVRLLLAAGADVDRRDPDSGRTALHAAVAGRADGAAPEIVRLLLDAGADVDATTTDGASALDITRVAAAQGRRGGNRAATDAVIELLVARGAAD